MRILHCLAARPFFMAAKTSDKLFLRPAGVRTPSQSPKRRRGQAELKSRAETKSRTSMRRAGGCITWGSAEADAGRKQVLQKRTMPRTLQRKGVLGFRAPTCRSNAEGTGIQTCRRSCWGLSAPHRRKLKKATAHWGKAKLIPCMEAIQPAAKALGKTQLLNSFTLLAKLTGDLTTGPSKRIEVLKEPCFRFHVSLLRTQHFGRALGPPLRACNTRKA